MQAGVWRKGDPRSLLVRRETWSATVEISVELPLKRVDQQII